MKASKHIAAALAAILLLTSCSVLGGLSSNTGMNAGTTTASTGSTTGSALAAIFNVLKNTGTIDLGNLTNLINLGQILMGANSLTNATQAYTAQFTQDLINGSNKLINNTNVNDVMAGLKKLASTDNSALNKATTAAFAGNLTPVSTSNKNVKTSVDAVTAIVNAMK